MSTQMPTLNRDELDLLSARLFTMLRPYLANGTPRWLDMRDACTYTGNISGKTMTKLINDGFVYAKRIGGEGSKLLIDRETIDTFLNVGRLN